MKDVHTCHNMKCGSVHLTITYACLRLSTERSCRGPESRFWWKRFRSVSNWSGLRGTTSPSSHVEEPKARGFGLDLR